MICKDFYRFSTDHLERRGKNCLFSTHVVRFHRAKTVTPYKNRYLQHSLSRTHVNIHDNGSSDDRQACERHSLMLICISTLLQSPAAARRGCGNTVLSRTPARPAAYAKSHPDAAEANRVRANCIACPSVLAMASGMPKSVTEENSGMQSSMQ